MTATTAAQQSLRRMIPINLLSSGDPINDPASLDVSEVRVETVFPFCPVPVFLQPFTEQWHQVPATLVDLFRERGD
jgi:hypothetical protein